jgi:rhodanese-related sulfurtransferase
MGKDANKKDLDRIEVATTLTYKPPTENTEGLLFRIKDGKMETKAPDPKDQSYVLYNPSTGRVEEAKIYLKLRGDLTVIIGGTETKVELDQTQVTTIESGNESFLKSDTPMPPKKP